MESLGRITDESVKVWFFRNGVMSGSETSTVLLMQVGRWIEEKREMEAFGDSKIVHMGWDF